MSYWVGNVAYDTAIDDKMPVSRLRGSSFVRPGINGYGVILTGLGGQQFSLAIDRVFATWAEAVVWGTAIQSMEKYIGTITTPRGSWPNCFVEQVVVPRIIKGYPHTVATALLKGRVS